MKPIKVIFILLFVLSLIGLTDNAVWAKESTPAKLKNPRLNALLTPMSQTATYMRVTPTSVISYDRMGKKVTDVEKNCDLIKDEETVAILRCPFNGINFKNSFVFHRFIDRDPIDDFDIGRCKINYDFELTKDKDFDIEAQEADITILYSTASKCKISPNQIK